MTQATPAPSVPESDAPTDQRRPKKWSGGLRLGLKKRYLLLVAVILLTVIPIISWVAWHELKLPGNPFAVLPPEAPPLEPAVPPTETFARYTGLRFLMPFLQLQLTSTSGG